MNTGTAGRVWRGLWRRVLLWLPLIRTQSWSLCRLLLDLCQHPVDFMLLPPERDEADVIQQMYVVNRVRIDRPSSTTCQCPGLLYAHVWLPFSFVCLHHANATQPLLVSCCHLLVTEPTREWPFVQAVHIRNAFRLLPAAQEDHQTHGLPHTTLHALEVPMEGVLPIIIPDLKAEPLEVLTEDVRLVSATPLRIYEDAQA